MRSSRNRRRWLAGTVAVGTAVAVAAATPALAGRGQHRANAGSSSAHDDRGSVQTSGILPREKYILRNTVRVNLDHHSATVPLHKGTFGGKTVWYILTEASDAGAADVLGLNFAPKLANLLQTPQVVQDVTLSTPTTSRFASAIVNFQGIPDFTPTRVLKAGSPHAFPPAVAQPGAVGDAHYSPFIRIKGTSIVYNAPIVAVGDGPFDVTHHTNTGDRVLAVHPARPAGPGQFYGASVELLIINGFDSAKPIIYLSTESSDAATAVLERATFVPLLAKSAYAGGDDFFGSGRERIFPFTNGQTGLNNPQAQGLTHLIVDGHASEDASLANTGLIRALQRNGDALNVQGDFPTLNAPRQAAYSPLWDATFGQWTDKAVRQGLNTRQTDEFALLHLAASRPDLLTGPMGAPYGSTNVLINCPVIAFTAAVPRDDTRTPAAGDAVDTFRAYQP